MDIRPADKAGRLGCGRCDTTRAGKLRSGAMRRFQDKFRALAYGLLTPEQTSTLLQRLWYLEQVPDIGEVIRLVHI